MKHPWQAVFLDRDGTIGGDDTTQVPGVFTLYPFARQAIDLLNGANVKVFVSPINPASPGVNAPAGSSRMN